MFDKRLKQVSARIHDTDNVDQMMLDASADICVLFNAERLTMYAVSADQTAIVSKVKTGLSNSTDLKLPISSQSIAGYVASSRQLLNLADAYDEPALRRIHPDLKFLKAVDQRSGYRTREMLVVPIAEDSTLYGVLQIINNRNNQTFSALEVDGALQLCRTLAIAIRQRVEKASLGLRRRATKYDGMVLSGALAAETLEQIWQMARTGGQPVEQVMITQFKVTAAQIGQSLARYFDVSYEPFQANRLRVESLHGMLKRDFVDKQGWIPLEESADGLMVMCTDPEMVRSSRIVPQVFPRVSRFSYRVTTQAEFQETLAQIFGAAGGVSIDEMLADMGGASIDDGSSDDSLESAAADNELVKFVNKVIVDAHHQKASDIHIEPMPGKLKTGIRFRIDGTLMPYIEVPAHFRQAMVTRLKIMCDLDISERRRPQDGKIK
ncbi:MAG: GspE/PulE family protein, partial [Betaproteobacteria bacterium]|nr:GspE/PulE family protein [Betaproteobacteria bacterium]